MEELINQLKNYKLSYIYGIFRGGLPIAVHLSHYLDVPMILNLKNAQEEKANMILIVDEFSDTGKTLYSVTRTFVRLKLNFMTAVLYHKPHSRYKPNFYVRETSNWIVMPWERFDEKPNREMYNHLTESNNENKGEQ